MTACETSLENSQCVWDNVVFYLQHIVILFFLSASLKFFVQIWLAANLKLNLIDKLVQKRYVEEINLKRKYDKSRSASFGINVQARIEENEQLMARRLQMLDKKRSIREELPLINENTTNVYAEISSNDGQ